jgi:RIO-like serine/threonine protein kinase
VKLAWAIMNIMNAIHHYGILHNDLSKNNIMLHFPTNKSNVVYIGLCDWGETRRMQKVTLCLYVFAKDQNIINKRKVC